MRFGFRALTETEPNTSRVGFSSDTGQRKNATTARPNNTEAIGCGTRSFMAWRSAPPSDNGGCWDDGTQRGRFANLKASRARDRSSNVLPRHG